MKAYVKKGCIDSNRDAHEAGAVVELDKKTDKKLWDLKLVEDYDVKKHGKAPENSSAALEEANEALDAANEKITALETANEALLDEIEKLKGLVDEAIELPKGRVPAGYVKA